MAEKDVELVIKKEYSGKNNLCVTGAIEIDGDIKVKYNIEDTERYGIVIIKKTFLGSTHEERVRNLEKMMQEAANN